MSQSVLIFTFLGAIAVVYGSGAAVGGQESSKSSSQGHGGETETTKLLRLDYPMNLECKITHESDVKMELAWYKDDVMIDSESTRYKIFQENSSLLIIKADKDDVGVYRCQTVDFQPPQSFNQTVVFLTFKNMDKSKTVMEGDKLYLYCDVDGKPMPIIKWLKDGVNVEDAVNQSRFTLGPNDEGTEDATFLVTEAIYDDRANYACIISTFDIQYNTTVYVRIKDMYAALWPFLGICAEVFVLCLIIFIYEKRRAKNDFEESDTDQPPEQKNTSDQNKDSVRQRK